MQILWARGKGSKPLVCLNLERGLCNWKNKEFGLSNDYCINTALQGLLRCAGHFMAYMDRIQGRVNRRHEIHSTTIMFL